MKIFIALTTYLLLLSSFAISIKIQGPCLEKPLIKKEYQNTKGLSVGDITVNFLEENNIPYVGAPLGINSMYGTPMGLDAIEILSRREMRAYGWCYQVDGEEPTILPNEFMIEDSHQEISWFFAYSEYDSGVWLNYCIPSYKLASEFVCPKN
jgi:hypothetical protein